MKNIQGTCLCEKNHLEIKEYGHFVYSCHCDMCRKMSAGPVMAVDPETSDNVVLKLDESSVAYYHSSPEVERAFCSTCGTYLFWHHLTRDHYCMNAELFPDIIKNAEFGLQVFYDRKPNYYDFSNETKKMSSQWEEM